MAFMIAAILCLAIFNLIVSRTEIDLSPIAPDVSARPPASARVAETRAEIPDIPLPETLARPLFSPTRRDFVAEAAPVEAVEAVATPVEETPAPPHVSLQGTRSIGGHQSALVAFDDQESNWVSVGDELSGWTVTDIGANRLVITRGSTRIESTLYPAAEN
jgi:hypothetical protein